MRVREERGLSASRFAREENEQRGSRQDPQPKQSNGTLTFQEIYKDIQVIREGLQEGDVEPQWLAALSVLSERVKHAARDEAERSTSGVNARLTTIETLLKKALQGPQTPTTTGTWADHAAGRVRPAYTSLTNPTRHTVRVTLAEAKGLSNQEILKEVKKTISGAAAIRVLKSGDIDVAVPDEATKDRAQGLPSTGTLKIHRKDYLVEVTGVPLSLKVAVGAHADNSLLANAICEGSRGLAAGLQVTRVKWLYDQHQLERLRKAGKTRGSLLVGFPTQDMRRKAILSGLVVNAQLFEVRQFETTLRETQCFRCQQWGHTQSACGRQARCGRCAGAHQTNECQEDKTSCANCSQKHKAWQKSACRTYQTYHDVIQAKRVAMLAQSSRIRDMNSTGTSTRVSSVEGWTRVSRKRTRETSPKEDSQRRAGRPTYIEQASRDPAQSRLLFAQGSQQQEEIPASMEIDTSSNE